jgi:hypothetical protein
MARARPVPRKWTPRNPFKYAGNPDNIVSRSSWETKFLNWCDTNPSVLQYASEELIIPYINPIDNKVHKYFVDFVVAVNNRAGDIRKYAVEIKPKHETMPPKKGRNGKVYLEESITYITNQAKWKAAEEFCKKVGLEFLVLTEDQLYITPRRKG